MQVAAIQMISGTRLQANLDAAGRLLAEAAAAGAELAVLPEYFCIMGQRDTDKLAFAEVMGNGPIQTFLSDAARRLDIWIVGGTLPLIDPTASAEAGGLPRARNSSLAFAPSGECIARYDKMHLFRFDDGQQQFDETRVLTPGDAPVHFDLPSRDGHSYRIGMSVCYDLRFPELYRALAADVLLVPSAFTYVTGQAHWELLLRARAIENLAYVVAPAQGGQHENGRRTWGHSLIAGPWGDVLAAVPAADGWGEAVVLATVQRAEIDARRNRLPALSHRVLADALPQRGR